LCRLTEMKQYRSPGGPPSGLGSPSPCTRTCMPSSTPAGIWTSSLRAPCVKPEPLHLRHGLVITAPAPRQVGQVVCTRKMPADWITCPCPPQRRQVSFFEPGSAPLPLHSSHLLWRSNSTF